MTSSCPSKAQVHCQWLTMACLAGSVHRSGMMLMQVFIVDQQVSHLDLLFINSFTTALQNKMWVTIEISCINGVSCYGSLVKLRKVFSTTIASFMKNVCEKNKCCMMLVSYLQIKTLNDNAGGSFLAQWFSLHWEGGQLDGLSPPRAPITWELFGLPYCFCCLLSRVRWVTVCQIKLLNAISVLVSTETGASNKKNHLVTIHVLSVSKQTIFNICIRLFKIHKIQRLLAFVSTSFVLVSLSLSHSRQPRCFYL